MNEGDASDVHTACRMRGEQERRRLANFATQDQPLQIAAGEGPRGTVRSGAPHVEALEHRSRKGGDRGAPKAAAAGEPRVVAFQRADVLGQGGVKAGAFAVAVFRDERDATFTTVPHGSAVERLAPAADRPRGGLAVAKQGFCET